MKKLLTIITLVVLLVVGVGCERWERNVKTFQSNIGGLDRVVEVYDHNGNLIKSYEGKLDVQSNEFGNKVLFDLDGKRVIINNAIVITEEK